jgi:hypothetical protein
MVEILETVLFFIEFSKTGDEGWTMYLYHYQLGFLVSILGVICALDWVTFRAFSLCSFLMTAFNYFLRHRAKKIVINAGDVVIIGASSGLGKQVAEDLERNGLRVFCTVRKSEDYEYFAQKKKEGKNFFPVKLDLVDKSSFETAFKAITAETNNIIGLYLNAGK